MTTYNKHCSICGKEYDYCPTCEKRKSWKLLSCSPECFKVHMILAEMRENVLSSREAYQQLKDNGVTKDNIMNKFIPSVAKVIADIFTENEVQIEHKKNKKNRE